MEPDQRDDRGVRVIKSINSPEQPLLLNDDDEGESHRFGNGVIPEEREVNSNGNNLFVPLEPHRALNYDQPTIARPDIKRRHSSATVLDIDERIRAENLIRDFIKSQDIENEGRKAYVKNDRLSPNDAYIEPVPMQQRRRRGNSHMSAEVESALEELLSVVSTEMDFGGRKAYVRHDRLSPNDAYVQPVPMQRRRRGNSHMSAEVESALEELLSVVSTEMDFGVPGGKLDTPPADRNWKESTKVVLKEMVGNFLGDSPNWYKYLILFFLVINPIIYAIDHTVAGWCVVVEFIITLAMALKCYPLEPGGLLAIEVVAIGMTSAESVYHEVELNLEVILLLMFMVAATHFLKHLLLFTFTKLLLFFENKIALCIAFQLASAVLSAFLDALTVTAVLIAVIMGLQKIYLRFQKRQKKMAEESGYVKQTPEQYAEAEEFKFFLRDLMMHAIVGTALGGGLTSVGEPQNLIIAEKMDWSFNDYFFRLAPVSVPVLFSGVITLIIVEYFRIFSYGHVLEPAVRQIISDHKERELAKQTPNDTSRLIVQGIVSVFIVIALALQLASVGIVGLAAIILVTAGNGIIEEEKLGKSFQDALPFTALLVVFFAIVAMIDTLELFRPIIDAVLEVDEIETKLLLFYVVTGVLSMISDNVFVATVYINELEAQFRDCVIDREEYDLLAVAVNSGTNVLSVATPNGQAAFLFLLTSALAPKLDLTYIRMVIMAFPYTIIMSFFGFIANYWILMPLTPLIESDLVIEHPEWPGCFEPTTPPGALDAFFSS